MITFIGRDQFTAAGLVFVFAVIEPVFYGLRYRFATGNMMNN